MTAAVMTSCSNGNIEWQAVRWVERVDNEETPSEAVPPLSFRAQHAPISPDGDEGDKSGSRGKSSS